MSSDTIGVGVAGLSMGRHVLQVNRDPESRFQVRALCELDESRIEKYSREYNVGFATKEYSEMVSRPDIDAVAVYTPDHLHAEHILMALDAGKHVLVTKPMVNTREEASKVLSKASETGLKVMVGHTRRFLPDILAARALMENGTIGEPVFLQFGYVHDMRTVIHTPGREWRRDPNKKSWLVGSACHPIDLALWFGGEAVEVFATANNGKVLEDERKGNNNFLINLVFRNGAVGRVLALFSVVDPPKNLSLAAVCGTKGSIVGSVVSVDKEGKTEELPLEIPREIDNEKSSTEGRLIADFEQCIVQNRRPSPDAAEAAETLEIFLCAGESTERNRPVTPDYSWISECTSNIM